MNTRPSPRGHIPALTFACMAVILPAIQAGELESLTLQYEAAKKEWQASRRPGPGGPFGGGPGGGGGRRGGGRGGWGQQQRPPELEPILASIAKLNTDASLAYLTKEYGDADPEIASRVGAAILLAEQKKAVSTVTRGFDRVGNWTPGAKVRVLDALARSKSEDGLAFVVRHATNGSDALRLLALGSLTLRPDDPKAVQTLVAAAKDRSLAVRRAAARALRTAKSKSVISPLIDRLAKESDPQLRIDVAQLLVDLTGQNMGLVAEDWKKWWEDAESGFAFGAKPAGSTRVVTPKLSYFGIEVSSKRIAFVVDVSQSMLEAPGASGQGWGRRGRGGAGGPGGGPGGGEAKEGERKFDHLKEELTALLKKLPEDSLVNIIPFSNAPQPWKKELHSLKGSGRDEVIAFIRGLTTSFGTNIYDSLELALKDDRVDTIYMLTDGEPYGGKYTASADIVREISALNRVRNVKIHCVGFGPEAAYLKDLSDGNGGDFRSIGGEPKPAAPPQKPISTGP